MIKNVTAVLIASGVVFALATQPIEAKVVRVVVERTAPYAGGKTFGEAGAFERLEGTVYMEVDPHDPLNAVIVNLDRAPRNDAGMVEFSAPFVIIKPVDMSRGNGKLLYGINNRGNAIEISFQTFPPLAPGASPESGDGLFFRLGYAFVDAGWAGGGPGRWQPDRGRHPDRVHRTGVCPAAQGQQPLQQLRNSRHEHDAVDPDGSRDD